MAPARVAIIGGGCGGVTAAYELSRPEMGGAFEVTLFQQGWRLGGKGASGRGPAARVEEHGLHIWLGFYDNAFRMMRDCYGALADLGERDRWGDWHEAFLPENEVGCGGIRDGRIEVWRGRFPTRPGLPGDPYPPGHRFTLTGYVGGMLAMMQMLLLDVDARAGPPQPPPAPDDPDRLAAAIRSLLWRGTAAGAFVVAEGLGLLAMALKQLPALPGGQVLALAERVASGLRLWIEKRLLIDDPQRPLWAMADIVLASIIGMLREGVFTNPRGLDVLDRYDCTEWLRLNGASEASLSIPYMRGLYDLGLAYEDGDPARPRSAAGQGIRGVMRLFFGYRGSVFWRMRAGMGDIVFAPLHRLLEARGVRFEFFHRLRNMALGEPDRPGGIPHVAALEFDIQARTLGGAPYRPLVEVKGRPCWPAAPDWTQLEDGARLAEARPDYECHWQRHVAEERRLEVGRDFDFVVLATSIGAVPYVAPELVARDPRWQAMVAKVKTVATQACQIWLKEDVDSLGFNGPPYVAAGFDKPFDTICDMAHVIPEEDWPEPPATAVYFCSVLEDPPEPVSDDDVDYPARRAADVRNNALGLVSSGLQPLLPGAFDAAGRFRWTLLADATGAGAPDGPARFDTQYWRANVSPSERYVLSLPGSIEFRLSPLDTSCDNLTIAGDWTACSLNSGCTESAVISGMLAAHALSGRPALADIIGFDHP